MSHLKNRMKRGHKDGRYFKNVASDRSRGHKQILLKQNNTMVKKVI